jgi:hypothetical protein
MLRRGALIYAMLVFLAGASLIREAAFGRLVKFEETWAALLARFASPHAANPPVTLVEITDDTLSRHAWPWAPEDFALFFHAVLPFRPDVLAVEPVLEFDRDVLAEKEPVYEKMLHDHILRAAKLVLGGRLGWAPDPEAVPELQPMPVLRKVHGDLGRVPEFTAVDSWAAEQYRLTTQPGWTNVPDAIGPRGLCPLIHRYRGQPVPGIVLQLVMHMERVTLDEVEVVLGSHVALGKARTIPIDDAGRMLVNFGVSFGRLSFDDLLLSREQIDRRETPVQSADLFTKRLVMLGRTDAESRTQVTPGGKKVSPAEYFAAAIATIQQRLFPSRIPGWFDWSLVGVAAVAALWIRKWKPILSVCLLLFVLAAYAACAFSIFNARQITLPAALPAGLAVWLLSLRLVARRIEKVIAF